MPSATCENNPMAKDQSSLKHVYKTDLIRHDGIPEYYTVAYQISPPCSNNRASFGGPSNALGGVNVSFTIGTDPSCTNGMRTTSNRQKTTSAVVQSHSVTSVDNSHRGEVLSNETQKCPPLGIRREQLSGVSRTTPALDPKSVPAGHRNPLPSAHLISHASGNRIITTIQCTTTSTTSRTKRADPVSTDSETRSAVIKQRSTKKVKRKRSKASGVLRESKTTADRADAADATGAGKTKSRRPPSSKWKVTHNHPVDIAPSSPSVSTTRLRHSSSSLFSTLLSIPASGDLSQQRRGVAGSSDNAICQTRNASARLNRGEYRSSRLRSRSHLLSSSSLPSTPFLGRGVVYGARDGSSRSEVYRVNRHDLMTTPMTSASSSSTSGSRGEVSLRDRVSSITLSEAVRGHPEAHFKEVKKRSPCFDAQCRMSQTPGVPVILSRDVDLMQDRRDSDTELTIGAPPSPPDDMALAGLHEIEISADPVNRKSNQTESHPDLSSSMARRHSSNYAVTRRRVISESPLAFPTPFLQPAGTSPIQVVNKTNGHDRKKPKPLKLRRRVPNSLHGSTGIERAVPIQPHKLRSMKYEMNRQKGIIIGVCHDALSTQYVACEGIR